MKAYELSKFMIEKAKKVSEMSMSNNVCVSGMGFAITIPSDTDADSMKAVDQELLSLMWSFERVRILGREHYVLFP